jgi:hypothetical protein
VEQAFNYVGSSMHKGSTKLVLSQLMFATP